jgi:hypothetical protein
LPKRNGLFLGGMKIAISLFEVSMNIVLAKLTLASLFLISLSAQAIYCGDLTKATVGFSELTLPLWKDQKETPFLQRTQNYPDESRSVTAFRQLADRTTAIATHDGILFIVNNLGKGYSTPTSQAVHQIIQLSHTELLVSSLFPSIFKVLKRNRSGQFEYAYTIGLDDRFGPLEKKGLGSFSTFTAENSSLFSQYRRSTDELESQSRGLSTRGEAYGNDTYVVARNSSGAATEVAYVSSGPAGDALRFLKRSAVTGRMEFDLSPNRRNIIMPSGTYLVNLNSSVVDGRIRLSADARNSTEKGAVRISWDRGDDGKIRIISNELISN